MWKSSRKEEERVAPANTVAYIPAAAAPPAPAPTPKSEVSPKMADIAHIGKSVIIRGELSGSEDLFLDGEVEGSIDLKGHSLTIGPNGKIRANVHAQEVVIHGRVDGTVRGASRVELKKTAVLSGDIFTQRISIEEGAFFKGAVDIQKPEAKPEVKPQPAAPATSAAAASATFTPAPPPAAAPAVEVK